MQVWKINCVVFGTSTVFQHPTHAVYQQHGDKLHTVFPVQFWGDEGRGPKRAGYMAGTLESMFRPRRVGV